MGAPPSPMRGPMAPGMPGPGGPGPTGPGALGSPMPTPNENEGHKAMALAQVKMAIDLLARAVAGFGAASEEGDAVFSAFKSLQRKLGLKAGEHGNLVPAQIEMMKNATVGGPDTGQMLAMQRARPPQPGPGGPFQ